MIQFLSINFFSWISSIFVGFFKSSRFLVSLCILLDYNSNYMFWPNFRAIFRLIVEQVKT